MTSIDDTLRFELERLKSDGTLRRLRRIEFRENATVSWLSTRDVIPLGSNDYLGLSVHPDVVAAHKEGLKWGSGSTGSRLTTGDLAVHETLEGEIAALKHAPAAILFSSGYSANIGTIPALVGRGDLIISDELNHASLIDGCRLSRAEIRIYRHADAAHARSLLVDRSSFRRVLVVTDGVFSMDGDLAPLPELVELCDDFDAWLMADDAHGTGVFGETGAGIVEHFGLVGRVPIQMGTLSKAVGGAGAFVAGSVPLIDWLRNRARSFVFSTAPSPAQSEAALAAIKIIRNSPDLRAKLFENTSQMRAGLNGLGQRILPGTSPIIPWIIGKSDDAVQLSAKLEERGVWIPAIRPPTVPQGSARLRVTVTATLDSEDIDWALARIGDVLEDGDHK